MRDFARDETGSAVRWFALSAAVLSMAAMAGARSLDWLSQPGHLALVASRAPGAAAKSVATAESGIDRMPTGSVPKSALMLRIR